MVSTPEEPPKIIAGHRTAPDLVDVSTFEVSGKTGSGGHERIHQSRRNANRIQNADVPKQAARAELVHSGITHPQDPRDLGDGQKAFSIFPPTPALYFVTVRRPLPLAECTALVGRGPVIDSVEVKRGGAAIGSGRSYFSSARCGQGLTDKAASELNGSPDGLGVALGNSELGWVVGTRLALVSGDEVVVTIVDGAGAPFEVYASHQETSYDVKLGTLIGTGSVRVP